ncbi:MAG: GNAT family N-acetyltransferase [Thaumarchaeota archaeon]|nr:GNAT family N-acetyltransferase [Nitrososphaerota archaeon]
MAVIIREGKEKDFPVLLSLIKELATFEGAADQVKNSVAQMKREKGAFGFFVAEEGGKVLGAAVYFFAYYTWVGKSLYLDDLYVRPEHRRKSVGSMLLERVFELAKREDCKRMRLMVLDWNEVAISFYKKHGGTITEEWLTCDFDAEGSKKLR